MDKVSARLNWHRVRGFFEKKKIELCGGLLLPSAVRYMEKRNFMFLKHLGRGAFGEVFSVLSPDKKSKIAVKLVKREEVSEKEIKMWPLFDHENILPILDIIRLKRFHLYLMPQLSTTLDKKLESFRFRFRSNAFNKCKRWLLDVLRALEYLHTNQVCHLDLKSNNVLISSDQRAVVCDFSFVNSTANPVIRFGLHHSYHPPEVTFTKLNEVDGIGFDVWSFGMLVFSVHSGGWFESQECDMSTWEQNVHPLLLRAFQVPFFKSLLSRTFPRSTIDETEVIMIINLLQGTLRYQPSLRPRASILCQHALWSRQMDTVLEVDSMWLRKGAEESQLDAIQAYDVNCSDPSVFLDAHASMHCEDVGSYKNITGKINETTHAPFIDVKFRINNNVEHVGNSTSSVVEISILGEQSTKETKQYFPRGTSIRSWKKSFKTWWFKRIWKWKFNNN